MRGYRIGYNIEGFEDKNYFIKTIGINEDDALDNLKESLNEYDRLNLCILYIVEIPLGQVTMGELSVAEYMKYFCK